MDNQKEQQKNVYITLRNQEKEYVGKEKILWVKQECLIEENRQLELECGRERVKLHMNLVQTY